MKIITYDQRLQSKLFCQQHLPQIWWLPHVYPSGLCVRFCLIKAMTKKMVWNGYSWKKNLMTVSRKNACWYHLTPWRIALDKGRAGMHAAGGVGTAVKHMPATFQQQQWIMGHWVQDLSCNELMSPAVKLWRVEVCMNEEKGGSGRMLDVPGDGRYSTQCEKISGRVCVCVLWTHACFWSKLFAMLLSF